MGSSQSSKSAATMTSGAGSTTVSDTWPHVNLRSGDTVIDINVNRDFCIDQV